MIDSRLAGRVALITGANHGIGAATAAALAAEGVAVFLTYKRLAPMNEPAYPAAYDEARAGHADEVVRRIRESGGTAEAVEADLADPETPKALFDLAEKAFGPVEILVNNASGWLGDTFTPSDSDGFGRPLRRVDAELSAARELGKYGITANMLYPPVTDTGWVNEKVAIEVAANGVLPEIAQPEEVAEVITFLASHQGRRVTGQRLRMY